MIIILPESAISGICDSVRLSVAIRVKLGIKGLLYGGIECRTSARIDPKVKMSKVKVTGL